MDHSACSFVAATGPHQTRARAALASCYSRDQRAFRCAHISLCVAFMRQRVRRRRFAHYPHRPSHWVSCASSSAPPPVSTEGNHSEAAHSGGRSGGGDGKSVAAPRSGAPSEAVSPGPQSSVSAPSRKYQPVDWETVEQLTAGLADRIRAEGRKFDVLLAVTRGGMVPATLLAHALELRNILSATVIFYTDAGEQFFGMTEPRFLSFPADSAIQQRHVLIVDDVWDSGRTATAVLERVKRAEPKSVATAVLHYKPTQSIVMHTTPDFYGQDVEDWIVYPWERFSPNFVNLKD